MLGIKVAPFYTSHSRLITVSLQSQTTKEMIACISESPSVNSIAKNVCVLVVWFLMVGADVFLI